MSRRFLPAVWAFTLLFLMMQVPAMAASYVVAPFKVSGAQGYSYLSQAVSSMLTSRLFLQGQFEPVARQDSALKESAPTSTDAFRTTPISILPCAIRDPRVKAPRSAAR